MKRFFMLFMINIMLLAFALPAGAEFVIDPDNWTVTGIGETGLSIKLPTGFEEKETACPENAEILLSAGDDDLEIQAYAFAADESLEDAFDDYCLWDADSMWETEVNGIAVIGFISSDDAVYGVMLLDDSGSAVELDFVISEDEERSARALNKASLMLETLTENK